MIAEHESTSLSGQAYKIEDLTQELFDCLCHGWNTCVLVHSCLPSCLAHSFAHSGKAKDLSIIQVLKTFINKMISSLSKHMANHRIVGCLFKHIDKSKQHFVSKPSIKQPSLRELQHEWNLRVTCVQFKKGKQMRTRWYNLYVKI
jgi:uncharacterized membrane protein